MQGRQHLSVTWLNAIPFPRSLCSAYWRSSITVNSSRFCMCIVGAVPWQVNTPQSNPFGCSGISTCRRVFLHFSPNNITGIYNLTLQWMYCHSLQSNLSTPHSSCTHWIKIRSSTSTRILSLPLWPVYRKTEHAYLILSQYVGLSFL